MNRPKGIVLVHGYTGSPSDLDLLAQKLSAFFGNNSVTNICLPGHGTGDIPRFDKKSFTDHISNAIDTYIKQNRRIILLGHSTGGTLLLSILMARSICPDLLILASVPKKIDSSYQVRWSRHRSGKNNVPFSSVAEMISLINSIDFKQSGFMCPVLVLQGEHDDLVPRKDFTAWKQDCADVYTRAVGIPAAKHDIFRGVNSGMAIDEVLRTISDVSFNWKDEYDKTLNTLFNIELEIRQFLSISPLSRPHLASFPGGQVVGGKTPLLSPSAKSDPVFANIEITTRCNLKCRFCARAILKRPVSDMPYEMFCSILDLLPHAYRITLVGLGEPLLHPHIADFISEAVSRGRRVALATNAMALDQTMSQELINSGLHSIAFSLDGPNQDTASAMRQGSDLEKIIRNIKEFVKIASSTRPMSTAVFSAVSIYTVSYLQQLIDIVKDLGVRVLMLTDLNFPQNVADTLWKGTDESIMATIQKAVSYAFSKGLPVLSVHALEEFGLVDRYKDFLLLPPSQLYRRSSQRTWCFSPWQTVPVDVNGNITVCDCQPEHIAGNLFRQPFSDIWNGEVMTEFRRHMLSETPPENCTICPRF